MEPQDGYCTVKQKVLALEHRYCSDHVWNSQRRMACPGSLLFWDNVLAGDRVLGDLAETCKRSVGTS